MSDSKLTLHPEGLIFTIRLLNFYTFAHVFGIKSL